MKCNFIGFNLRFAQEYWGIGSVAGAGNVMCSLACSVLMAVLSAMQRGLWYEWRWFVFSQVSCSFLGIGRDWAESNILT